MTDAKHKLTIELDGDAMVYLHELTIGNGMSMEEVAAKIIESRARVSWTVNAETILAKAKGHQ